ncbi:hypothetical protein H4Q26_010109 [Puccinia striiformis f. sp. tritici PST-130]|nr:hypothetical protein H4Q26_010109 [Puccinia striiformis f. sp. tritici PST-130]
MPWRVWGNAALTALHAGDADLQPVGVVPVFNCRHDEYLSTPHPIYYPILCNGDGSPRRELASLGHKSSIDNRDEISDFPSSSRMVELSPVDQVSVDMSPSNDVSTYGTMIRKHNSPYQIPTPDERAMIAGRDARADSVSPNVAITRTREWEEEGTRVQVTKPQPPEVFVVAYDPTLKRVE